MILGGEEDPAASAEAYGWISAAVWTFMPRLEELMRIPDPYIHLDVDYNARETRAEGEIGLFFQIRDLFAIGFAFGIPGTEVAAAVEEGEKAAGGGRAGRTGPDGPEDGRNRRCENA